jgi:hypothetical protein
MVISIGISSLMQVSNKWKGACLGTLDLYERRVQACFIPFIVSDEGSFHHATPHAFASKSSRRTTIVPQRFRGNMERRCGHDRGSLACVKRGFTSRVLVLRHRTGRRSEGDRIEGGRSGTKRVHMNSGVKTRRRHIQTTGEGYLRMGELRCKSEAKRGQCSYSCPVPLITMTITHVFLSICNPTCTLYLSIPERKGNGRGES